MYFISIDTDQILFTFQNKENKNPKLNRNLMLFHYIVNMINEKIKIELVLKRKTFTWNFKNDSTQLLNFISLM